VLHHDQKDREALDAYRVAAAKGSVAAKCYAAILGDRLEGTETSSVVISEALRAEPNNEHCLTLRARDLVYDDRAKEAAAIMRAVVERVPDDAFFFASLGFACFTAMDYDEAAAAFEKSVELDPTLPANVFNAGYAHYLGAKYSKAKPLLEKAVTLKIDDELKERAKEALEVISGALWVCPMHPEETGKSGEKCKICGMPLEPLPHGLAEQDEQ
jgi:Flp pilus assembly protein TadD